MHKPVILITPDSIERGPAPGRGGFCPAPYIQAISQAGGLPLVLPLTDDPDTLDRLLALGQGLLLSGGDDFAEPYYPAPLTARERASLNNVDETRDRMELHLVRRAAAADLPTLGICRGLQVQNLALGGSLQADVPGHKQAGVADYRHPLDWLADGQLRRALASCRAVNSTHHQAVGEAAPGFAVLARAPDGIIEVMELPGKRFFGGVQFHPERLVDHSAACRQLFVALVNAATASAPVSRDSACTGTPATTG